ncbi:carboxypeptidase regulatory-like domain-containing protein [Petroclostridium sp. X23]|uniref:carboxypeptidase regulatory-like domain-containing protein n=1 Tax=Petroclostridium sp. X23 TaxID=3045146 RepID=UPI0024ADF2E8|nr:carboxypeptidase regulatory-like domain-containing protein [Petroclostridium sp. X23]WHH57905.1 carboxypeptidase regulatory-like domain-containing protein [Petroclostridium sp. X23]
MNVKKKWSSQFLSLFLAFVMAFSLLAPGTAVNAQNALREELSVDSTNPDVTMSNQAQVVNFPLVSKSKLSTGTSNKLQLMSALEASSVNDAVYSTVYNAVYNAKGIQIYFDNYFTYYQTAPADFEVSIQGFTKEEVKDLSFTVSLENQNSSVTYSDTDSQVAKQTDEDGAVSIKMPVDLEGNYQLTVTAFDQSGQAVFASEPSEVVFELVEKYYLINSSEYEITLENTVIQQQLSREAIELVLLDDNDQIIAGTSYKASSKGDDLYLNNGGNGSTTIYGGILHKMDEISPGEYQLYLKVNEEMISLGDEAKLTFTDSPILASISVAEEYQNGSSIKPFIPGSSSFDLFVNGYNLARKHLTINLLDSANNIVAASGIANYQYYGGYDAVTGYTRLTYRMNISAGQQIIAGEQYFVQIVNDGPEVVSNIEEAFISPDTEPRVIGVETDEMNTGRLIVKTVNFNIGEEYILDLRDYSWEYAPENFRSYGIVNPDGTISFSIIGEDGQPMRLTSGYFNLYYNNGRYDEYVTYGNYSFSSSSVSQLYYASPQQLPAGVTEYIATLEIRGASIDETSSIEVDLIDRWNMVESPPVLSSQNVVGTMSPDTISIDSPYTIDGDKVYTVTGKIALTEPVNEDIRYAYNVRINGQPINTYSDDYYYDIYNRTVAVVSDVRVGDVDFEDATYSENPDFGYMNIISTGLSEVRFTMSEVMNADLSKMRIELRDDNDNVAAIADEADIIISPSANGATQEYAGSFRLASPLEERKMYRIYVLYLYEEDDAYEQIGGSSSVMATGLPNCWVGVQTLISVNQQSPIYISLESVLNINTDALGFRLIDLKDAANIIPVEIAPSSIQIEDDNRYMWMRANIGAGMHEGTYILQLLQDGVPTGVTKTIYAIRHPYIRGTMRSWHNDDPEPTYFFTGGNMGSGRNYQAVLYSSDYEYKNGSYYSEGEGGYQTTISLGQPNENGNLEIPKTAIDMLTNGSYHAYIEMDGSTIGNAYLYVETNGETIGTPEVKINQGARYTNDRNVTLNIDAAGYQLFRVADSQQALAAASYNSVQTVKQWQLSEGDGQKTVFVQFKNNEGLESEVLSQSIYLDTIVPEAPLNVQLNGESSAQVDEEGYVYLTALAKERNLYAYATFYAGDTVLGIYKLSYADRLGNDYLFGSNIRIAKTIASADAVKIYFIDLAGNKSAESAAASMTVSRLVNVDGILTAGSNNVPYHYVELRKMSDTGEQQIVRGVYTTGQGQFDLGRIPNGTYTLYAYSWGQYRATEQQLTVDGQDLSGLNFALNDSYSGRGTLTVTVRDEEGNLVPNAWINISKWQEYLYYSGQTDESGQIVFADVPIGMLYDVYLYYNSYNDYDNTIRIDSAGENKQVTYTVPVFETITGTVTKEGAPVSGVQIQAYSSSRYEWAQSQTDGTFTFNVPKSNTETYTVAILPSTAGVPLQSKYEQVASGTSNIDFVLADGAKIEGKVTDNAGNTLSDARISTYGGDMGEYHSTTVNSAGNYSLGYVFGPGTHTISAWAPGYYTKQETVTITQQDVIDQKGFVTDLSLTPYGYAYTFDSSHNSVITDVTTIQRGRNITAEVNYHNASTASLQDVTIEATIPEGTSVIASSLTDGAVANGQTVTKTVSSLSANGSQDNADRGHMTFMLRVDEDYVGDTVVISANANFDGNTAVIGFAEVAVVSATLNAPEQVGIDEADRTKSKSFRVYGEATQGSKVVIMDRDTQEVFAVTAPNGKWYSTEIQLPAPLDGSDKTYHLVARATKGTMSGLSPSVPVTVKNSAIEVQDIILTSSGGQNIGRNRDTGIAAFSVWVNSQMQGKPIEARVKLSNTYAGDQVEYVFLGNSYPATLDDEGYWKGDITGWSGTGTQQLIIRIKYGEFWVEFIVGELTILIDPSGYVYDAYTGERIQGATAICEQLVDGAWVQWNAEAYGQVNPQLTDDEGKYGWMVPEGTYRVLVQKEGYESYATTFDPKYSDAGGNSTIIIPPPREDVNIGLVNIQSPMVQSTTPTDGSAAAVNTPVTVVFNKSMDTTTITAESFVVRDSSDQAVDGTITFAEGDTKVIFTPTAVFAGDETYNVVLKNTIKDKTDKALNQYYTFSFSTQTAPDTESPEVTAQPAGATYNSAQQVTLTISEPGSIYYTLDGSEPTTTSTLYTGSITISDTTTLKFIGIDTAGNQSDVYTETYTIQIAPAVTYGDVSGDGQITAGDATLILRSVVGLATLSATQTQAADVSGDGQITAGDATLVLRKVVGLITKFPVESN